MAFAGFILIGLAAGVGGMLLPAQITDYDVTRRTIGLMFVTFSAGYVLSGAANGWLVSRFGARGDLALGTAVFIAGAGCMVARPAFGALLLVNLCLGFGTGILDAGLNAYLAHLPRGTALLNHLHAFFGVGALLGPLLAGAMLDAGLRWNTVYLALGLLAVPLAACFVLLYPAAVPAGGHRPPLLRPTMRRSAVWLAGLFLCVYVGVEVSVGNWSVSWLMEVRDQTRLHAGWVASGYWLGLTLGRFTLNTIGERLGLDPSGLTFACVGGVLASTALAWLAPAAPVSAVGLVLVGYFLGPLFPTAIAVIPRLVPLAQVPTAVGMVVGLSVVGGAAFPWLAGALAQQVGLGSLLPYALALSLVMLVSWWTVARRVPASGGGAPGGAVLTAPPGARPSGGPPPGARLPGDPPPGARLPGDPLPGDPLPGDPLPGGPLPGGPPPAPRPQSR